MNTALNWRAVQHRINGIATIFVLVDPAEPATILGYYSLSSASLTLERLTEADRKGPPAYPLPAVRIGRLAASIAHRGQRLGELPLANALKRTLRARHTLGVYAVVVEAKDPADLQRLRRQRRSAPTAGKASRYCLHLHRRLRRRRTPASPETQQPVQACAPA